MSTYNKRETACKWWESLPAERKKSLRSIYVVSQSIRETEIFRIWEGEMKRDAQPVPSLSVLDEPGDLDKKWSRWDLYMMLYNLTPGGSEFALDPKACVDYVKREVNSTPQIVKDLKQQINKLNGEWAEMIIELDCRSKENERLKAQNENLQAAIKKAMEELVYRDTLNL